jgi:hypothetical protein
MRLVPNTSAKTLALALEYDPDWFHEECLAESPDMECWPFLFTFASLTEQVKPHELDRLVEYGTEVNRDFWKSDSARTPITAHLVSRLGRLLNINPDSGSIIFWGYDSLIQWITASTPTDPIGYVYYQEGAKPNSRILVKEMGPDDILDAILETWRRGGCRGPIARQRLCDMVAAAIDIDRQVTTKPVSG